MSDTQFPPTQEENEAPPMTLGARLTNIFVSPGEVFDEVKKRPHEPSNWLVPAVISIIVGIVFTFVVFSQPQIIQGIHEMQEKQMQQMVDQGKMTRQQADNAMTMAEKFSGPSAMKVYGTIGTMFGVAIQLFLTALLVWAIGRLVLKAEFDYGKALEVVGLGMTIMVIDTIVKMLLAEIYSNASITPGPVLLVAGHFNPQNRVHMFLAWMDIFIFWQIGVWSLGLAKVSGQSFVKSLVWLGGCILVLAGTCVGGALFMAHLLGRLGGK